VSRFKMRISPKPFDLIYFLEEILAKIARYSLLQATVLERHLYTLLAQSANLLSRIYA